MASLTNSSSSPSTTTSGLVAGQFAIDFARSQSESAGGQAAFAIQGAVSPSLMAVQVNRGWPARARALQDLTSTIIPNLLTPLAHGPAPLPTGEMGYFVVTAAPVGRPLSTVTEPWSESDLISRVLRPAAAALRELEKRGLTHRALRLDNVFYNGNADPVVLGCAWAGPAGYLQPAASEPPYMAVCSPAGQGDGLIADDVYALGYLMVCLTLGRDPLAGLDAETIIQRKLDLGSYAAIVGQGRLSPMISDLVRGMLAEDPEHRPSPTLLGDPVAARARRSSARTPRRSQRALNIGGMAVWTPRMLAHAILRKPAQCMAPLRNGTVGFWLRRGVGDAELAAHLDNTVAGPGSVDLHDPREADALLAMRAVAVLDPLAPMIWRETVLWPASLGAALNNAMQTAPESSGKEALIELARSNLIDAWGGLRVGRPEQTVARNLAWSLNKWTSLKPREGAALRLNYALNPLSPCESPLLPRSWVTRLADLLPAMETGVSDRRAAAVLDPSILAFIAVRRDQQIDAGIGRVLAAVEIEEPLTSISVLATIQIATRVGPLPKLAAWMAPSVTDIIGTLHSQTRRQRLTERLATAVQVGDLPAMVAVVENPAEREADLTGRSNAVARVAAITQMLAVLERNAAARRHGAKRTGHEIASGAGMLALGVALATAVLF